MSRLRMFLAKLFVLLTLSLGRMPHVVALLELLQPPSVAHVLHIRRRRLAYTEFFTLLDRDGRPRGILRQPFAEWVMDIQHARRLQLQ